MSFANKAENKKVFTDDEVEIEKARLHDEIHLLGIRMDETRAEAERHDQILKEKKADLDKVLGQLFSHGPELQKNHEELLNIKKQIEAAYAVLEENSELDLLNISKREELEATNTNVALLEARAKALELKVNEFTEEIIKLTNSRDGVALEIKNLEKELLDKRAGFEGEISTLKNIILDLKNTTAELENSSIQHANSVMDSKQVLEAHKTTLSGIKKELESIQQEVVATKLKTEEEAQKKKTELDAREKELETREGAASLKESWLKEKADSLIGIKNEVEKHLGRKIHISTPKEYVL